jgi:LuxR family maltose regulon positive regulatory protein
MIVGTHLERPQNGLDTIKRTRLVDDLNKARDKRLIMILAPAGYGKTTILSDWIVSTPVKSAWLSLDPNFNDLAVFLAYFIAAVQTINPRLCEKSQMLLNGPHLPSLSYLTATLINDLSVLTTDVVVVLEDYHLIRNMQVHEFVSSLINRMPKHLHLAVSTRIDPPLPLAQWRARGYMAEFRIANLRFTQEEARAYLKNKIGVDLPENVISDLMGLSEGWITGLKLAAISIRDRAMRSGSAVTIEAAASDIQATRANRHIADYLLEDVFARQPKPVREFLMRTSILERFTAPLCDALHIDELESNSAKTLNQARYVLRWIERSNLFLEPLDTEGRWYRYHGLFRDLLVQRLLRKHDSATIDALHRRAGDWLANAGLIDEAIPHYLTAGDPQCAADLIEAHRHALLNKDDWQTLEHWLNLLPESLIQERPDLLVARCWVLSFRGRGAEVATTAQRAWEILSLQHNDDPKRGVLLGEIGVHRAHMNYYSSRFEEAVASAKVAVDMTPKDHTYVMGTSVTIYGLSAHAMGRTDEALRLLEACIADDPGNRAPTIQRAMLTIAWIFCQSGDWNKALSTARYVLKQTQSKGSELIEGWSRLPVAWCLYEQNELDLAVEQFDAIVQQRYNGVHWRCAISGLCGLGLSYWAQGRVDEAEKVADMLDEYTLDTRNADQIAVAQAFRAHLNVLAENTGPALHWAQTDTDKFDFQPLVWTEVPLITRIRAHAAGDSKESRECAMALLQRGLTYARDTQNMWREVELLAVQALVLQNEGRHEAALEVLDHALTLASPGHFVRSFIDLGPNLGKLLAELIHRKRHAEYARELLSIIEQSVRKPQKSVRKPSGSLVEPLTARELEILNLLGQYRSNDEIAQTLFISPVTVKSHIRHLFEKMGVNRRRFAIAKAKDLGLLP